MHRRHFLTLSAAGALAAPAALRAQAEEPLQLRRLYTDDRDFSETARSLEGDRVLFEGFMAPPLEANSTFFVLTKMPMSVCPFCETEAEWPDDILAVYTKRVYRVAPFNRKILVRGALELGPYRDPDTGFLSMVRAVNATFDFA